MGSLASRPQKEKRQRAKVKNVLRSFDYFAVRGLGGGCRRPMVVKGCRLSIKVGEDMDRKGWEMVGGAGWIHPHYRTEEDALRGPCVPRFRLTLNNVSPAKVVVYEYALHGCGRVDVAAGLIFEWLGPSTDSSSFRVDHHHLVPETGQDVPTFVFFPSQIVVLPSSPPSPPFFPPTTSDGDDVSPMFCCCSKHSQLLFSHLNCSGLPPLFCVVSSVVVKYSGVICCL